MWSTLLLPSVLGPLWPGVVAPNRVPSHETELFEIELFFTFNCVNKKLLMLN